MLLHAIVTTSEWVSWLDPTDPKQATVDDALDQSGDSAFASEDVFADAVELDVDGVSDLFGWQGEFTLGVGDEHDTKLACCVIDFCECQTCSVDSDETLFDEERHLVFGLWRELESVSN